MLSFVWFFSFAILSEHFSCHCFLFRNIVLMTRQHSICWLSHSAFLHSFWFSACVVLTSCWTMFGYVQRQSRISLVSSGKSLVCRNTCACIWKYPTSIWHQISKEGFPSSSFPFSSSSVFLIVSQLSRESSPQTCAWPGPWLPQWNFHTLGSVSSSSHWRILLILSLFLPRMS